MATKFVAYRIRRHNASPLQTIITGVDFGGILNETRTLVEYCHSIAKKPLPAKVNAHAKLLLLDYMGVAAAGAAMEQSSKMVTDVVEVMGGAPEASAFGLQERIPAANAAFANGLTEHSIEMDDTHSASSAHPGAVMWSVGLAMAERAKVNGDALLPAVAAGYEMACRVGYAGAPPSLYKRGFHPTSVMGAFGAAVTAAALLNLSYEQMLNAVGIAGSFSSGNMEYLAEGTLTKRVQPGQAAQAGILAALLAERGYTGPATILEGEFGFLHAYSDAAVASRLTDDLGKEWEIEWTGIKAFGCCRYMQSPMEASLNAVRGQDWKPEDVKEIRVGLVSAGWGLVADPIEDKYVPQTRVDGQFSLPFGVATALVHGYATVNEFREEQLKNPKILALAKRVTIHHDDALDKAYPALWPSWSEIYLNDGRVMRGTINTTKGEPENPLTPDEVRAKFTNLGGTYWSAADLKGVMEWVEDAESKPVRALMDWARVGSR